MSESRLFRLALVGLAVLGVAGAELVVASPAAAAGNVVMVPAASALDSTSPKEALASCPRGTRVLGGGGYVEGGARRVHLTRVQALGSSDRFAVAAHENGAYSAAWRVHAYAICGREPAGLEYISFQTVRDSSDLKVADAHCPRGKQLLSTGMRIHGGGGDVVTNGFGPIILANDQVRAWAYEDENGYGGEWSLWAHGVCAYPLPGLLPYPVSKTDSDDKFLTAYCPAGKELYGVGVDVDSDDVDVFGQVHLVGAYPTGGPIGTNAYAVEDPTGVSSEWELYSIAICADV